MTNGLAYLRHCAGVSQARMAELMGMPLRTYEDVEAGRTSYRPIHQTAGEMALLRLAVEKSDLNILPQSLRSLVAELSNLVVLDMAETDAEIASNQKGSL